MSVVWKKIGNKSIIPTIAAETIKWLCEILVTTTAYLHLSKLCGKNAGGTASISHSSLCLLCK